mmetsp:Transcript_29468/g.94290  ORF Transcript_29468/g.94290 Transcript_29468/m.94290 type:complete len:288 (+) Transcript_29468:112-975(+)
MSGAAGCASQAREARLAGMGRHNRNCPVGLDGLLLCRVARHMLRNRGGARAQAPAIDPLAQLARGALHIGQRHCRSASNSQRSTHSRWKRWPHRSTRSVSPLSKSSTQMAHAWAVSPPRASSTASTSSSLSSGGCASRPTRLRGARARACRSSATSCLMGHVRSSSAVLYSSRGRRHTAARTSSGARDVPPPSAAGSSAAHHDENGGGVAAGSCSAVRGRRAGCDRVRTRCRSLSSFWLRRLRPPWKHQPTARSMAANQPSPRLPSPRLLLLLLPLLRSGIGTAGSA